MAAGLTGGRGRSHTGGRVSTKSSAGWRAFAAVAWVVVAAGAGCGAGGGMLAGAGGSGTTTGRGGANAECSNLPRPALKVIPDVMIALDTSASMNDPIDGSCTASCASKWAASVDGINAVTNATAGRINWGLTFIAGSANACDPGFAARVGVTDAISPALANRTTGGALAVTGNRPTRAAVDFAAAQLSTSPIGQEQVILLITDGTPGCGAGASDVFADDTTDTVRAVGDAFGGAVATFVVGLATSGGPAETALSEMAVSGGLARADTPAYFPASSSAELVTALNALVSTTADCVFAVPPPVGTDGREGSDNIAVMLDDAAVPLDVTNGWTFADTWRHAIRLHGASCDAVTNSTPRKVGIVYFCQFGP